jgi:hypothetical protein
MKYIIESIKSALCNEITIRIYGSGKMLLNFNFFK